MKKNATPELSAKWWSANQPEGLASAKDLEKALGDYEAALAKLKKDGPENNLSACLKALTQTEGAAKKLQGEAEKLVKSPPKKSKSTPEDYQNTVEALKKYPKIVDAARKEAEGSAKTAAAEDDDEDQEGEGLLHDEEGYKKYLKGVMRRLKQRSMNFAVGIGKKPGEHRFLFHKTKPGKSMVAGIKQETDLKKFTWGIAGGHEEKPTTLVLALEGPQAPGLKKKAEKLFKIFKPLPFDKVLLMVEGEEAEDIGDPEDLEEEEGATATAAPPPPPPPPKQEQPAADPGAAFKARLAALLPAIQKAIAEKRPEGEDAKLKASEAGVFARKKEFEEANRLLDRVEETLKSATPASSGSSVEAALANWKSVRSNAIATLKEIAKEIAAAKHAESKNALIELNAVIKNFSAEPDTPAKVSELERYLEKDDVVLDVCEIAEDIRTPLLEVLTEIKTKLAA